MPSSKEDIDALANQVHSVITKSNEAACPIRKSLRKKDNIWWNSEIASLRKEACRAWRNAIKTKQEKDWEAQKLALSYSTSKKLSEEQSAIQCIALKRVRIVKHQPLGW